MPFSPPAAKARYRFAPVPAVTLLSLACAFITACGGGGGGSSSGGDADVPPAVTAAEGLVLLAGDVDGPGNLDGTGTQARFQSPSEIVVDRDGNLYVVDDAQHLLRKVSPQGEVTTVSSATAPYRLPNRPGAAVSSGGVSGLAADPAGGVMLTGGGLVRKVDPSGAVTLLARVATRDARWGVPERDRIIDSQGRMFGLRRSALDDTSTQTMRVVRIVRDGPDSGESEVDVPSALGAPGDQMSLAVDPGGRVHLAWNRAGTTQVRLFRMDDVGVFQPRSPLVDVAAVFAAGRGTGRPTVALPALHAVDAEGRAYLMDYFGSRFAFARVAPSGEVVLIGSPSEAGGADGSLSTARFRFVSDIATDAAGNVYVADSHNHNIRKIDPQGRVGTLAGSRARDSLRALAAPAARAGGVIGTGIEDLLVSPSGKDVHLLFLLGNPAYDSYCRAKPQCLAEAEAWQRAHASQLFRLGGDAASFTALSLASDFERSSTGGNRVGRDASGNFYFHGGKTSPDGTPLPLASAQTLLVDPQRGTTMVPEAMVVDRQGVVTSSYGRALVRWRPGSDGPESLLQAGRPSALPVSPVRDGKLTGAVLAGAGAMATDAAGNVYFPDRSDHWHEDTHALIRRMSPDGTVTTLAGRPGQVGSADGQGAAASFLYPSDVALDSAGNLYVADTFNHTVRKVTPDGTVSTLVGQAGRRGIRLGPLPATLDAVVAIEIDAQDVLYIATPYAVLKVKLPK